MPKIILITGATGLIGGHIINAISNRGDQYLALTTNVESAKKKLTGAKRIVSLNDYLSLKDEKIDAIVNLAGKNLGERRWNDKFKKQAYDSRINTTRNLVELISKMQHKPEVLVSASGVDYYGDKGEENVYEDSPNADNFLGNLCKDWESEALKAEQYGVRAVVLRTGFVIAKNSKAVDKLVLPYKLFAGGSIGSGKQFMSWIHIVDLAGIYLYAVDNTNLRGEFNATAPNPETMKEFSKNIAKVLRRPSFFPVPAFAVKLIAGEMAEVVLTGRKALPKKIMDLGYKYKFPDAVDAWRNVLSNQN